MSRDLVALEVWILFNLPLFAPKLRWSRQVEHLERCRELQLSQKN